MSLSNLVKNDQGSISILVVVIIFVTLIVLTFIGTLVNGFTVANRLNNAADRIALGAATNLISNPEIVCDTASDLAIRNEVELQFCEINDDEVVLRVTAGEKIQSWLDRWQQIGMARAGIDYAFD
jgi:secretion/DNA translocation related TadE-like protein